MICQEDGRQILFASLKKIRIYLQFSFLGSPQRRLSGEMRGRQVYPELHLVQVTQDLRILQQKGRNKGERKQGLSSGNSKDGGWCLPVRLCELYPVFSSSAKPVAYSYSALRKTILLDHLKRAGRQRRGEGNRLLLFNILIMFSSNWPSPLNCMYLSEFFCLVFSLNEPSALGV